MQNDNIITLKNKTFNLNQIGAWLAFVGTLFMFWQFMRDIHKENVESRERIRAIEVKIEERTKK